MHPFDLTLPSPNGVQILLTLGSVAVALLALQKVFVPTWRWFGRVGNRITGALDNLGGREAFVDPATGKLVEAIPPIGERLTSIDTRLDSLLNVNARLDSHEARLGDHDASIASLIAATFERGAHDVLKAVEKRNEGVIDGEATE